MTVMPLPTRTEIIQDLQDIVQTDRHRWKVTAFARAISAALTAFNKDRPLTATGNISLRAGKGLYAADDCLIRYLGSYWALEEPRTPTWSDDYHGALPRIHAIRTAHGMAIQFMPPPGAKLINLYGREFEYLYSVGHVLSDDDCSIRADDIDLFMTRALAALMKELVASNVTDPIQLHKGLGSLPNSATPLAAYEALMKAYQEGVEL